MPKKAHRDYVDYEVAFPVTVTFNPQEPFVATTYTALHGAVKRLYGPSRGRKRHEF